MTAITATALKSHRRRRRSARPFASSRFPSLSLKLTIYHFLRRFGTLFENNYDSLTLYILMLAR